MTGVQSDELTLTGKWPAGAGEGSVQVQSQYCNQSLLEWEALRGEPA